MRHMFFSPAIHLHIAGLLCLGGAALYVVCLANPWNSIVRSMLVFASISLIGGGVFSLSIHNSSDVPVSELFSVILIGFPTSLSALLTSFETGDRISAALTAIAAFAVAAAVMSLVYASLTHLAPVCAFSAIASGSMGLLHSASRLRSSHRKCPPVRR